MPQWAKTKWMTIVILIGISKKIYNNKVKTIFSKNKFEILSRNSFYIEISSIFFYLININLLIING